MKKLFVIFAVAAMFVACNKPTTESTEATDSVATQEVVDTTAAVVDSAAAVVDSTATAM